MPTASAEVEERWVGEILAGTGELGYQDGAATEASFTRMNGLCFDPTDRGVVILDGPRLRKWSPEGEIQTLFNFESLMPQQERSYHLLACDVDAQGNIFMTETRGAGIYQFSAQGELKTFIDASQCDEKWKDGPLEEACAFFPRSLVVSGSGEIYFSDDFKLRQIVGNQVTTLNADQRFENAGTHHPGQSEAPSTGDIKGVSFSPIMTLEVNHMDQLYIADVRLRKIMRLDGAQVSNFAFNDHLNQHNWIHPEFITFAEKQKQLYVLSSESFYKVNAEHSEEIQFDFVHSSLSRPNPHQRPEYRALAVNPEGSELYFADLVNHQLLRLRKELN